MQNQNTRRVMPMVKFAQHRMNPGATAAAIAKSDAANSQPFPGKPPAFLAFNQQRTAAHAAAHRANVTKAAKTAEIRKRDLILSEALAAIDAVLHPNAVRKTGGPKPTVGLGALLQARAAAKKRGVK